MKLVVFADSHTDLETMRLVVEVENPDIIVHLGDHIRDGIELRELFVDIPMVLIKGNTDQTNDYPAEKLFLLDDKLIFITHGHQYDVEQGIEDITREGTRCSADIILFGHTHKPYLNNHKGVWIMNPGRIGRKSSKKINATYGIVILDSATIKCKIVKLKSKKL